MIIKLYRILIVALIIAFFYKCSSINNNKEELIVAEYILNNDSAVFKLYSDSTYKFNIKYSHPNYEKIENHWGRCFFKGDSLIFYPSSFRMIHADTAIVKNNFIEFINGEKPFRLKIKKAKINIQSEFNAINHDYSVFYFNSKHEKYLFSSSKHYNLKEPELLVVDSILSLAIDQNKERISLKISDYYKQCIAVTDSINNKIVWVNCSCKPRVDKDSTFQYYIISVNDGGDCFFSIKINLTKRSYFDLLVNGSA